MNQETRSMRPTIERFGVEFVIQAPGLPSLILDVTEAVALIDDLEAVIMAKMLEDYAAGMAIYTMARRYRKCTKTINECARNAGVRRPQEYLAKVRAEAGAKGGRHRPPVKAVANNKKLP